MSNKKFVDEEANPTTFNFTANPILVSYFNFYFYLALIPFKTGLDPFDNKYKVKTYLLQQIICGIAHVGIIFYVVYMTFYKLLKIESHNDAFSIIPFFDIVSNIGIGTCIIFVVFTFWRRKDNYLRMIDSTRLTFDCENHKYLKIIPILVYAGLVTVIIFFGVIAWLMVAEQLMCQPKQFVKLDRLEPDYIENCMDNRNNKGNGSIASPAEDEHVVTMYELVVKYLLVVYLSQSFMACQGIFMVLALSLLFLGKQFGNEMREQCCFGATGIEQGLLKYRKLKSATDNIRNTYGNALLGYYFCVVAYYAEAPHVLLGIRGEVEKLLLAYFAISGVIWLIAAEFHNSVKTTLLEWIELHINRDGISIDHRLRLYAISAEIAAQDSNTIALANKCFPVTYKNLGSMLGLVVTYGIIVFQLQQQGLRRMNADKHDNITY